MSSVFIIVTYNAEGFLKDCLQSVTAQDPSFEEIIVVDNHSTDATAAILSTFPGIRVLRLSENSGYAAAANAGIRESTADLVMVANPDLILTPGFHSRILRAFREDGELAMASPLLLRFDGTTVDSAGQAATPSLHPREIGYNQPRSGLKIRPVSLFSVCGALTVFRRSALERLAVQGEYYDEDFFMFWEDFDLGWRADLYGLKRRLIPEAEALHYRSGSMRKGRLAKFSLALARPPFIRYHIVKNRYLTLIKNFRWHRNRWSLPFILLKDLFWLPLLTLGSPKIIIQLLRSGPVFRRARQKRRRIKNHE